MKRSTPRLSKALVLVDTTRCPACDYPLREFCSTEPALIRGAGYGESRETCVMICDACGWSLSHATTARAPERIS